MTKASKLKVRSVFVSSDRNHYIDELRQELAPLRVYICLIDVKI